MPSKLHGPIDTSPGDWLLRWRWHDRSYDSMRREIILEFLVAERKWSGTISTRKKRGNWRRWPLRPDQIDDFRAMLPAEEIGHAMRAAMLKPPTTPSPPGEWVPVQNARLDLKIDTKAIELGIGKLTDTVKLHLPLTRTI